MFSDRRLLALEGSGISRGNRFTARGLAHLLHLFEAQATLLRSGDGRRCL